MYARKSRKGSRVKITEIPEAAADYLANEQWGKTKEEDKDIDPEILSWLKNRKKKFPNIHFDCSPCTIEELKKFIKNVTRIFDLD